MKEKELELEILKTRFEGLNERVNFLEKNWIDWTKATKETGQKLIIALTEKIEGIK